MTPGCKIINKIQTYRSVQYSALASQNIPPNSVISSDSYHNHFLTAQLCYAHMLTHQLNSPLHIGQSMSHLQLLCTFCTMHMQNTAATAKCHLNSDNSQIVKNLWSTCSYLDSRSPHRKHVWNTSEWGKTFYRLWTVAFTGCMMEKQTPHSLFCSEA